MLNPNFPDQPNNSISCSSPKRGSVSFGDYFGSFGDAGGTEWFLLLLVMLSFNCSWGLCDLEDDPEERLSLDFASIKEIKIKTNKWIKTTFGKKHKISAHVRKFSRTIFILEKRQTKQSDKKKMSAQWRTESHPELQE